MKQKHTAPNIDPRLALAGGVLGASMSAILARLNTAPALITALYRMVWSACLLTPYVLLKNRAEIKRLRRHDILFSALAGVLLALHFAAWYQSLQLTTVAVAGALICTDAIFTTLGYVLFFKAKLSKWSVLAIFLSFCGSVIIAMAPASQQGTASVWGNVLSLAGAVFLAIYTLIGKKQRAHLSTGTYTWLCYSFSAVTLLFLCMGTGTPLWGWGTRPLVIGFLLAVFCTLLGHSVFTWCLKYLSPAFVSTAKLAEPVLASLAAAVLFHEYPPFQQIIGAAVVLSGIVLLTLTEQKGQNLS